MNLLAIGIVVYVLGQLLIAQYASRKIRTESDYLVAGRKLGPVVATFTIFATWFGVETCIGVAGKVAVTGLYEGNAEPFGYAIALIIAGLITAKKVWDRKIFTIGDVFRNSFGTKAELLVVLLLMPSSVLWAAAQIRTFGAIVGNATEISTNTGILFASAAVIIYTVRGGLIADAITDLIQGIVLIVGLAVLVAVFFWQLPSLGEAWTQIPPGKLKLFSPEASLLSHIDAWLIPIAGTLIAQELIVKMAASRSHHVARSACIWSGVGYLTIGLLPVTIAVFAASIPITLDQENLDQFLLEVGRYYLPDILYVVFAGALISAVLSTVDTALLVASSLICHNVLIPKLGIEEEARKLRLTRLGVLIAGLSATFLAYSSDSVYELVIEASAFGGGGLVVMFLVGLYKGESDGGAAIFGILTGTLVYSVGYYGFELEGSYFLSMLASLVAYFASHKLGLFTDAMTDHG